MAILKKSTEETSIETEAGFVPPVETSTATTEPVQSAAENVTQSETVDTQEVATVAPAGAVSVKEKPKYASMMSLKNAITPGLFGYGANKIVASNSQGMMKPDGVLLGETFDAQVLSFNYRWSVGPADIPKNDTDAKFLFRDSYDKKTIVDTELGEVSIEEYAKTIPEKYQGYEVKEYFDVIVAAISCANKAVEEDFLEKMLFVVQVSPSIVGKFNFFAGAAGMKAMTGRMDPKHQTCMRFRGVPGPNTTYNYSIFKFESCPAEVLANYEPIDAAALVG